MAGISSSGGGIRQQRAAELKAEAERKARLEEEATRREAEQAQAGDGEDTEDQGTGPIAQGDYVVKQGDCMSSIAYNHGFFWETLWDLPENSELKETRKDPNVLLVGDRVTIPELRRKEEPGATEEHHRFRRLGEPSMLRLRLLKDPDEQQAYEPKEQSEESHRDPNAFVGGDPEMDYSPSEPVPRADVPYVLIIDGTRQTGATDEDGRIEVPIPGNARRGKLVLNPGTEDEETMSLKLGSISPITELTGVKERLANLTLDCGQLNDEMTPELAGALCVFQEKYELEVTGEADEATRDKLLEVHGC